MNIAVNVHKMCNEKGGRFVPIKRPCDFYNAFLFCSVFDKILDFPFIFRTFQGDNKHDQIKSLLPNSLIPSFIRLNRIVVGTLDPECTCTKISDCVHVYY